MGVLWMVLFVALTGSHFVYGLPLNPTPQVYPHDIGQAHTEEWGTEMGMYAVVPAVMVLLTIVVLLFGCTWCYWREDCKPNEGAENQLFTASAAHLHDARRNHPPDSGFSEPINNNISEDNNNGPISLREMQNIANNNAAAYIVSDNEQRNRVSRESVVEFEPLPNGIRVADPLEHCADWFDDDHFTRNRLQYLREIHRGWFGRVVEGEIEHSGSTSTVAVKILNQNVSLEDKARFLDEAKMYRDSQHENVLRYISKCLQEDPWIMIFELCSMNLQQYLVMNRPKMAILNESGVPLQLMCDVTSALAHLHSRGYIYRDLWSGAVLVRGAAENVRAVLGQYTTADSPPEHSAPETQREHPAHTTQSDVWSLGGVVWEVCAWGAAPPHRPPPPPDLPCLYRNHLYQVMQLCWNPEPAGRPSAAQVNALLTHLHAAHVRPPSDDNSTAHFEERWQRLKPNSIPIVDEHTPKLAEHVAIVHAPSTSTRSHFTGSDHDFDNAHSMQDTLSVDMDTAVSRSSSIMSDRDPLSIQIKSESLTNLHGSLEDVRNIYLTHNEMAVLECHQANVMEDREHDRSDSSVDPWLKDIMAGSQDDVSYYRDVSDVIKNLDNILNSEKTSSSESSHQASPSRDNLSLDCKKDYPMQSSMVKSPGISNFQNILEVGFSKRDDSDAFEEDDRDTIGTLSHSFERHSDTISQHTLENLTPDTPIKEEISHIIESPTHTEPINKIETVVVDKSLQAAKLPKEDVEDSSLSKLLMLKELCLASLSSVSEVKIEKSHDNKDCVISCDNLKIDSKSINNTNTKPVSYSGTEKEIEINATELQNQEIFKEEDENTNLPLLVQETLEKREIPVESVPPDHLDCLPLSGNSVETTDQTVEVSQPNDLIPSEVIINEHAEYIENASAKEEKAVCDLLPTEKVDISECEQAPEQVQIATEEKIVNITVKAGSLDEKTNTLKDMTSAMPILPPDLVQSHNVDYCDKIEYNDVTDTDVVEVTNETLKEQSMDSTAYMDLINDTHNENITSNIQQDNASDDRTYYSISVDPNAAVNESTVYLDLPTVIKDVDKFLFFERAFISKDNFQNVTASTPKGSLGSENEALNFSEDKLECGVEKTLEMSAEVQDFSHGITLTRLEQKCVPENLSPYESPTKSHHTDTYDENSSVVLGPFENCTLKLFTGVKSAELGDFPKEELLVFSSNFSEINLETPSPLRDGNFLNEVPDLVNDEPQSNDFTTKSKATPVTVQFEDILTVDERKPESEPQSHVEDLENSLTEKHISPSTPPNSPGVFLASTSQQKYLVDIDLNPPNEIIINETDSDLNSLQKEIDLNQIELQITSKLAMAENENNMNLEYSGPLTVEGLVSEDSEIIPESYLAGNGGSIEEFRDGFTLDEENVKALRNELELKLPLAQVASIEPQCEGEGGWCGELPPPPHLIVNYPGALSPIVEETGHQLSAYENDTHWSASARTDSSESYPEPYSAEEATDLATATALPDLNLTYTYQTPSFVGRTYTLPPDYTTSKEITMSADSLNASSNEKSNETSPINDRTYTIEDKCERISQVSPFILSPTTDTSLPNNSDVTGVSTLSKTTLPTDAKHSKPSETQCLSKATSIDSWCSNDTLYNVEENFDDLALDPDLPQFETADIEKEENSESSQTLTHNEDVKEASRCSTYFIHDTPSERCDSFSPDSITAHDNENTYTKLKTDVVENTPSINKTEGNDTTKNTQTKDLAYETLLSGLPSYSNCTTEALTGADEAWNLRQPEMVRKSLVEEINISPPKLPELQDSIVDSPENKLEPQIDEKYEVDIICLKDNVHECIKFENIETNIPPVETNSTQFNFVETLLTCPSTSTPLTDKIIETEENVDVSVYRTNLPVEPLNNCEKNLSCSLNLQDIDLKQLGATNANNGVTDKILHQENSKKISSSNQKDVSAIDASTLSCGMSTFNKVEELQQAEEQNQIYEQSLENHEVMQGEGKKSSDVNSKEQSSQNLGNNEMYCEVLLDEHSKGSNSQKGAFMVEDCTPSCTNMEMLTSNKPQKIHSIEQSFSNEFENELLNEGKSEEQDSSQKGTSAVDERTLSYTNLNKPQDENEKFIQSSESKELKNEFLQDDNTLSFTNFENSLVKKPQVSIQSTETSECKKVENESLLQGEAKDFGPSRNISKVDDSTLSYANFQMSIVNKPQDILLREQSSQNSECKEIKNESSLQRQGPEFDSPENNVKVEDSTLSYTNFQMSIAKKPQDIHLREQSCESFENVEKNNSTLEDHKPSYTNCEESLVNKPQGEREKSIQSSESKEVKSEFLQNDSTLSFTNFEKSLVNKPQDIPSIQAIQNSECKKIENESLLQEETKDFGPSRNISKLDDSTLSYANFQMSVVNKPQDIHLREQSCEENIEKNNSMPEDLTPFYKNCEASLENKPQEIHSRYGPNISESEEVKNILEGETKNSFNQHYTSTANNHKHSYTTLESSVESKPGEILSKEGFTQNVNKNEIKKYISLMGKGEVAIVQKDSSEIDDNIRNELFQGEKSKNCSDRKETSMVDDHTPSQMNAEESITNKVQNSEVTVEFGNSLINSIDNQTSVVDASAKLLNSERKASEFDMFETANDLTITSQLNKKTEPMQILDVSPPNVTNLNESQKPDVDETNVYLNDFYEKEIDQPLSLIITENQINRAEGSPIEADDHETNDIDLNKTYICQETNELLNEVSPDVDTNAMNGVCVDLDKIIDNIPSKETSDGRETEGEPMSIVNLNSETNQTQNSSNRNQSPNDNEIKCNGDLENYATVNFLNETFEELIESNVDESDIKDPTASDNLEANCSHIENVEKVTNDANQSPQHTKSSADGKMTLLMEDFLENEKKFCELDSYLPLLSDIRFTGPATEIMSTSFSLESPAEESADRPVHPDAAHILKEWDSDTDSHTSNSSGEFIWKDGDGHETALVPSTHFDHHGNGSQGGDTGGPTEGDGQGSDGSQGSGGSGDSGSEGSEGDDTEFVPSSWDCLAEPAKSSLRSLEQATPDNKKRVVFKRQKYHCVYEYPREVVDAESEAHSPPAYVPDLSTYADWDPTSAEEAELGYGQIFCSPNPLDLYHLRAGIAFGADYDEDFFISSSARPFESLGIMSTTSQFFPGMHVKPSLLDQDMGDHLSDFPPPPSPLHTTLVHNRTPSLDFTTPDSGVEDMTPGSTTSADEKLVTDTELSHCWKTMDSASSSESVSPSSPGGEALGGLRHTRDKLKLDLPPSPHVASPRHNRVFNFVLEKPKRQRQAEDKTESGSSPLVMTDETPIITTSLPLDKDTEDVTVPEPTFSTFGKCTQKIEPEQKIILTDETQDEQNELKEDSSHVKEAVKGEGTVLDSGDEDSGIESSAKATLERKKPNVS